MKIPLDYVMVVGVHIIEVTGEEYSSSLTRGFRLDNESFAILLLGVVLASIVWVFRREEPSLREELVIIWEDLLHAHQVPCKVVLSCQCVHAREVIDPLVWLHLLQLLTLHSSILPTYVPILLLRSCQLHFIILLRYVSHNVVLGLHHIHDQMLLLWPSLSLLAYLFFCNSRHPVTCETLRFG